MYLQLPTLWKRQWRHASITASSVVSKLRATCQTALISPASFFPLLSLTSHLLSSPLFLFTPCFRPCLKVVFPGSAKPPLLLQNKNKERRGAKAQPLRLCFLFKNASIWYKWKVWTHHKPTQYSLKQKPWRYLTPHQRGAASKPNVKWINKNHEVSLAELADRLDVGRGEASWLGERHGEKGMPATLTSPSQTWDVPHMLLFLGTLNSAIRIGEKGETERELKHSRVPCIPLPWSPIWIPSLWPANVSPGGHGSPLICFICDPWPLMPCPLKHRLCKQSLSVHFHLFTASLLSLSEY